MSKELIEKWENGTLDEGYYYVRLINGTIMHFFYDSRLKADITSWEVLAPVPTYYQFADVSKTIEMLENQLSYAMGALNFYGKNKGLGGNCARDALKKIERARVKYGVQK